MRTEHIGTEVFFLPAAAHTEKDGTFTNTQRLLQWHDKAVEPPWPRRCAGWACRPPRRTPRRPWAAAGLLLADALTFGGLLFGVDPGRAPSVVDGLAERGVPAAVIGSVRGGTGRLTVRA